MRLREVMALTDARPISLNINPTTEVHAGFAADLMSDALRYDLSQALLVSGLANPQVVRTAEMADVLILALISVVFLALAALLFTFKEYLVQD